MAILLFIVARDLYSKMMMQIVRLKTVGIDVSNSSVKRSVSQVHSKELAWPEQNQLRETKSMGNGHHVTSVSASCISSLILIRSASRGISVVGYSRPNHSLSPRLLLSVSLDCLPCSQRNTDLVVIEGKTQIGR